ncbi:ATP-binding response regulator [Bellilinea sp.]|uniref:ATP-binding response regulator n=1 Tax=Bellilinea sp. TaxID=2838785 RepID=UPI002ADD4081|nr:response regulator [Bellilinea sp.]
MVMNREKFAALFKDLISHLNDPTIMETHPLSQYFPAADSDSSTPRARAIQQLILQEIEQLRPPGKDPQFESAVWRPYLILYKRYVLGETPREIANSLYIGDRQFRRDHSRALQALSSRIWERYFVPKADQKTAEQPTAENEFVLHFERLDLAEVLRSLEAILSQRLQSEQILLHLHIPPYPLPVSADRVLLRQMVLSLINYGLQMCSADRIEIGIERDPRLTSIQIKFETDENWESVREESRHLLSYIRTWGERMYVSIEEQYPPPGWKGQVSLSLIFPSAKHRTILVVDDQAVALKMFERYLSHTGLQVIGLNDPEQTLQVASHLQPDLIILDVMMPRLDGWEVLQSLQSNPSTRKIPVLVCSAWDEPELAYSLGAAAFLKKPLLQRTLLDVLYQLNFLE